jgi:hypothetical protein
LLSTCITTSSSNHVVTKPFFITSFSRHTDINSLHHLVS